MKPVFQDRFGDQVGNCVQACLASILELPLDQVFDPSPWWAKGDAAGGFAALNSWLDQYGLELMQVPAPLGVGMTGVPAGYWIATTDQGDITHASVWKGAQLAHDPDPRNEHGEDGLGELLAMNVLVCNDPVKAAA